MKIRYFHVSEPGVEKVHDTEKSLKGCIGLIHALGGEMTQELWDQNELTRFASDMKQGRILSYSVMEDGKR